MTRQSTPRFSSALFTILITGLAAILLGVPDAAMLAAPWVALLSLGIGAPRPTSVDVAMTLDRDRVMVGDTLTLTCDATADADAIITIQPAELAHHRPLAPRTDVIVDGRACVELTMVTSTWGTHELGRAEVFVTEPFGLFQSRALFDDPVRVRTHPTPVELRALLSPALVRPVTGTHSSRQIGRGVEYADVREFRTGDSIRDINWRATARSSDIWVSDRHPDRATTVVLLIDSFVASGPDVHRIFGAAIEAAISLAKSHLGVTDRVGLIEFGGVLRWVNPGTGQLQLQQLTDALLSTSLFATAADKELPLLPARSLPPRSFIVALSPLVDQRFIDALHTARARGHDVAAIHYVSLPQTPIADLTPSENTALRLWTAEREVQREQLLQHGIAVVPWVRGDHLDTAVHQLLALRRRAAGTAR